MNQNIAQYIEEELVISKATSHPDETIYTYMPDGRIRLANGNIVYNTLSTDFLGMNKVESNTPNFRISGNFYCGQSDAVVQLQNTISQFLQTEDTIVFGSYEALCADIMTSLLNTEDVAIYDAAMSVPMRKGVQNCQADKMRFYHNDMQKLEDALKLSQLRRIRLIITDGIFFDSGVCAKLQEIRQLASKYDAISIIDDSFGFLTTGKKGRGSDELCGVRGFQDLKIVNMQHALCCSSGVFVSGNKNLIQLLKLRSRCYKHTLSISESDAIRAKKIIESIINDPSPIETLHQKAISLQKKLLAEGFECNKTSAGIVSFLSDTPIDKIKAKLRDLGILAQYSKVGRNTLASIKVSTLCDF